MLNVFFRDVLLNPVKDIKELNKRLDFIDFALLPPNKGFIKNLRDCIKEIRNVDVNIIHISFSILSLYSYFYFLSLSVWALIIMFLVFGKYEKKLCIIAQGWFFKGGF